MLSSRCLDHCDRPTGDVSGVAVLSCALSSTLSSIIVPNAVNPNADKMLFICVSFPKTRFSLSLHLLPAVPGTLWSTRSKVPLLYSPSLALQAPPRIKPCKFCKKMHFYLGHNVMPRKPNSVWYGGPHIKKSASTRRAPSCRCLFLAHAFVGQSWSTVGQGCVEIGRSK